MKTTQTVMAMKVMNERLKDELAMEKDGNGALKRALDEKASLLREAYDANATCQADINRLTNELAQAKTKVSRLERVVRGLRDAFLAATEEEPSGRPFR